MAENLRKSSENVERGRERERGKLLGTLLRRVEGHVCVTKRSHHPMLPQPSRVRIALEIACSYWGIEVL